MFSIKRSPARVCWHVMFNGEFFEAAQTKREAQVIVDNYEKLYGRP